MSFNRDPDTTTRAENQQAPQLVAIKDAAALHPWATTRYLRRLIGDGRIAYYRLAERLFVATKDLDAFEAARRVEVAE